MMTQLERNKAVLQKYIPESCTGIIAEWIVKYNFKLKIKRTRSSKEGDYMPPHAGKNHTITINHDLNKYAFLVTLIHEIAHLITWEQYKGRVYAHGQEWKTEYSKLLRYFVQLNHSLEEESKIFPKEVLAALNKHLVNPSAASCSDLHLSRILRKYDAPSESSAIFLERIITGASFRLANKRSKHADEIFIKGNKRRSRYKCIHARSRREYLIHALCKVEII